MFSEFFDQRLDIQLNATNERLNKIMLALTIVTIMMIPPGVIGGIMGMNVSVPG